MSEVLTFEDFLRGAGTTGTPEAKPYTDQPRITGTAEIANKLEVAQLSVTSINNLRALQNEWFARESARQLAARYPFGLSPIFEHAAKAEADSSAAASIYGEFGDFNRKYLLQFIPETDPDFDTQLTVLNSYSINSMDDMTYLVGPLEADGSRDHSKAGIDQVSKDWKTAGGKTRSAAPTPAPIPTPEPTPEPEPTPDPTDTITDPVDTDDTDIDVAALETLFNDSKTGLAAARVELAKLQTGFRYKFGWNGPKRRRALESAKEAYQAAVVANTKAGLDLVKAQADDPISPETTRELALWAYASEFHDLTEELKKPEYATAGNYGKVVRKLGNMGLGKKVAIAAASAGASVAIAFTGGVALAVGAFGLAGWRGVRGAVSGPIGHANEKNSAKVIDKLVKKTDESARENINKLADDADEARIALTLGAQVLSSVERIHKSDARRRKISAAVTGLSLGIGALGAYDKIRDISDWSLFKKSLMPGSGSARPDASDVDPGTSIPNIPVNPHDVVPPVTSVPEINYGWNPATGDLFRSDILMPVLDGQGFAYDVEAAGLVPKGCGYELALYMHRLGLDDGAHIPGFKNMGMWHTSTGFSPWSTDAQRALNDFLAGAR